MFDRSKARSRFAWISAAVLTLMVLSAGTVAADTTPRERDVTQNGTSAEVYASSCTANGDDTTTCSDLGLFVFAGKMSDSFSGVSHGNQVCANVGTYTFDDATGELVGDPVFESGCEVDLPKGTVQIGSNPSSVTLASTTIEVYQVHLRRGNLRAKFEPRHRSLRYLDRRRTDLRLEVPLVQ